MAKLLQHLGSKLQKLWGSLPRLSLQFSTGGAEAAHRDRTGRREDKAVQPLSFAFNLVV
jgi:hypothetical protein